MVEQPHQMKRYAEVEAMLAAHVAYRIGTSPNEIDRARRFDHLGLDSADAVVLMGELEDFVGRPLSAALPYTFPTIEQLARHVADDAS